MIHIGQAIEAELREQERTVSSSFGLRPYENLSDFS